MQKVNGVLLLVFIILVVACFLMGCVEKSSGSSQPAKTYPEERDDLFTCYGYQRVPSVGYIAVAHYDKGNVTLFIADDGIAAIPDYELNRSQDYSIVQEALEASKIKA